MSGYKILFVKICFVYIHSCAQLRRILGDYAEWRATVLEWDTIVRHCPELRDIAWNRAKLREIARYCVKLHARNLMRASKIHLCWKPYYRVTQKGSGFRDHGICCVCFLHSGFPVAVFSFLGFIQTKTQSNLHISNLRVSGCH